MSPRAALSAAGERAPPPASRAAPRVGVRHGEPVSGVRVLAEEAAIAFTYDFTSQAVMMATPRDLEDFAVGFSLSEGLIGDAEEIESLEIAVQPLGVDLRIGLSAARREAFVARRRHMAGPAGCGLCGVESLAEARRALPRVAAEPRFTAAQVAEALATLAPAQVLNAETRAVHAAGFWRPGLGLVALREDVGRHNALDKLIGALARAGERGRPAIGEGLLMLTSRVSIELVQKAAMIGAPVLVAVSAPSALAVEAADQANITLAAIARADGFEVFTHPHRLAL
ncbi:formate dehydrogenase accessory sulfurtransferase FdhD [Caulobacter sp. KR2-114]|uniref:formate dehydrogenase accessory sulfurtransferase FdhD n=1 Tax=Caulobacter sp. KR2-114 TaxID=3400912 RepID=UPI003C03C3A4